MPAKKAKSSKPPRRTWRDTPDSTHQNDLLAWPNPESLRPSISTIERYVDGDHSALAIIAAWRSPQVREQVVNA